MFPPPLPLPGMLQPGIGTFLIPILLLDYMLTTWNAYVKYSGIIIFSILYLQLLHFKNIFIFICLLQSLVVDMIFH